MMRRVRGKQALGGLWLAGALMVMGCEGASQVSADQQPPAVGRPAGVSTGPRVGVVVVAAADVRIEPSAGGSFLAAEGTMLVRDDRLVTGSGPDSYVIVELYNGHLIRLGNGTDTKIEKIAVFEAGRAREDLALRFEEMLRKEELEQPELRGAISRVAGWNSRMTAAETIATMPTQRPQREMKKEAPGGAGDPMENAPQLDSPADPIPEPPKSKLPVEDGQDGQPGNGKTSTSRPQLDEPIKLPQGSRGKGQPVPETEPQADAKKLDAKAFDLPGEVKFTPTGGTGRTIELPSVLVSDRKALAACAGHGGTLKVRIEAKKVVEIVTDKQKTCALPTNRVVALGDGLLEIHVQ